MINSRLRAAFAAFFIALIPALSFAQVEDYSTNPNNNNSAPPNGAPEGMAPSTVNDVLREVMASIAIEAQINRVKVLNSVAGTNTITGSMAPALTAYSNGMLVTFTPANNNTAAATLAVNGLAALDVLKEDGDVIVSGDLRATTPAVLVLDAGADDWILLNPQSANLSNGVAMSDLARLSQANTFTQPQTVSHATLPFIRLLESGASANNHRWVWYLQNEDMCFGPENDSGSSSCAITATRTSNTVDSIALAATTVAVNGTLDVNGSADIGDGTNSVLLRGASDGSLRLRGITTGVANLSYLLGQDSAGSSAWYVGDGTSGGQTLQLVNATGTGGIQLITNAAERLFVDADGSWDVSGTAGTSGQVLTSNGSGSTPTWQSQVHSAADITSGTLAVARGGTGTTTSTGTGNVVLSASPTLTGTVSGAAASFSGTVAAATVNGTTLQANGSTVRSAALDRIARMRNTNSGAGCTLASNTGVTSCVHNSTGSWTVDYTAAGFSAAPVCMATAATTNFIVSVQSVSATQIDVRGVVAATVASADGVWNLMCLGQ